MTRIRTSVLTATFVVLAGTLALFLVLFTGRSTGSGPGFVPKLGSGENAADEAGEGPVGGYDAYLYAARAYPAKTLSPRLAARAEATFNRIARRDARALRLGRGFFAAGHKWKLYGPKQYALQPGVLSFSGATNVTASRTTSLVVSPSCRKHGCRMWASVAGGGVWRTDNALADNPKWKQVGAKDLDQNSSGQLTLDPTDKKGKPTLYYGTGEANRCSSGCEAGVGIYRSNDGGEHWRKLPDVCVNNATYTCASPGKDAFLGRGISKIVIDPRDKNHIYVGSALGVRGLSHTVGVGTETQRCEPGANEPGLYESTDGGTTFTEVWNGAKPDMNALNCPAGPISYGITDVGLDPLNRNTVYAAGFDAGAWRRDAGAPATAFNKVFAAQFVTGSGTNRTMFALTVKNGHTRIYLTDGTQPATASIADPRAANFWRTDNANQPAAALLASQGAACTAPDPATHTFPATYNGWQCLTSQTTSNPYFATDAFCTQQCWYDNRVYSPPGMPDTVYVIGSNLYGEQPCNTKGVGCGNGRSNGREVLYSTTAGDPDAANNLRTFTDLSYDSQNTLAPWCAFGPYPGLFVVGMGDCLRAPNAIHPDQHAITINPSNPTQIFEASDGGVIRTSGEFADISAQCDERGRAGNLTAGSQLACKRLLSRVPTLIEHIDKKLSSTIQFINVAINPAESCEVMGGTQDNGTWSNIDNCDRNTFHQVIYGDGGNASYDATNPTWRANEFTFGQADANFRNGDPERWVIIGAPVVNSGESIGFYWPQVSDPNPAPGTHPLYSGAQHVWRSWAFGAGHPTTSGSQDTIPDIAFYEANCQEFVVSSADSRCGDFRPLGGPMCEVPPTPPRAVPLPTCPGTSGDLTSAVYGSDRTGGAISWIARDSADHGTLWAATSAGRIFVTHEADAADPSTVTWHRIDNATSPTRFPSSIYVDPADPGHAWISYSGYNAVTPTTPGHVFDVHENGPAAGSGTFTSLNVEGGTSAFPTPTDDGDLPVSDIVRDDATHTLYVSTDFGVLQGPNDGAGGWHVTAGMPRYEVMHLAIQPSSRAPTCEDVGPCKRILYAATHSQGIWQMRLGGTAHSH
jgi:hypothetical protein